MNFSSIKKAHFVGIGGIGMSALARVFLDRGIAVTGSDMKANDNTRLLEKAGAQIEIGSQKGTFVTKNTDVVIYSSAVPVSNAERQAADTLGIPEYDYHEALGIYTQDAYNAVVTGSHGKTTTTAMLGSILAKTKLNPTVIVGSNIPGFEGNVRLGSEENNVIEGDEYNKGVLYLHPTTVVLTNIEWDHPDIYPTESEYIDVFQDFVNKLPSEGHYIYNADDHNSVEHIMKPECPAASFGIENQNADLVAKNIKIAHGRQIFRLVYKGQELKDFNITIPGTYNIYNALAASLAALEMGVPQDTIKDALATFKGAWRRFEKIGEFAKATVISDYGHHPTEIEAVIKAAQEFYENSQIIVYFQPHHKSRTRSLLLDFVHALDQSQYKHLILHEIYDVPGRTEDDAISSKDIIKKMKNKNVDFVDDFDSGLEIAKKKLGKDDVLLVVGAGDIDEEVRKRI
jgi:UDP-N-acetylmuramate--alanine ligase